MSYFPSRRIQFYRKVTKNVYHFEIQTPQPIFEGTYNATLKNQEKIIPKI